MPIDPTSLIISLPGHLLAVKADQYFKEFNIFKGWIMLLPTGQNSNPNDPDCALLQ